MIKNIIFDFDGVILDSVPIKTEAFRKLFIGFPHDKVDELLEYHRLNGGISRYVKIRYFFEELLGESISQAELEHYAKKYSELTLHELSNPRYLIHDALHFIETNFGCIAMHVASGADENDLKHICNRLNLTKYFLSINGSPTTKVDIVRNILTEYQYVEEETCLIGDSINDYEAAHKNNICFLGYNNDDLIDLGTRYLKSMTEFER